MATKKSVPRHSPMVAEDRAWQARSDAETLARAEEIRGDRSRHSAARQHASKEAAKLMRIAKPTVRGRAR